jgi:hypothetical protein
VRLRPGNTRRRGNASSELSLGGGFRAARPLAAAAMEGYAGQKSADHRGALSKHLQMRPSMKRVISILAVALLAVVSLVAEFFVTAALAAEDSEFQSLFDGRTLSGWEGDESIFRIEDGAIVGGTLKAPIARNEFLCTRVEFGDFELRLRFKVLGVGANGGVQLRSRRIPNDHEVRGYQADLGDGWWGSLYDESRRNRVLAKADPAVVEKALKRDDWNDYTIRCQGRRIRLWINGQQTVDYLESDDRVEQTGVIALQIHGGAASEAWYKDIRINRL